MLLTYIAACTWMIRRFRKFAIALLAITCFLINAVAASVTGTVIDSEGAAIRKAQIVIRTDSSGRRGAVKRSDLILETDAKGHFTANLSPSFYDVCVMADAFSPNCQKLLISTASLTINIQLKADPEVMKRLGDVF